MTAREKILRYEKMPLAPDVRHIVEAGLKLGHSPIWECGPAEARARLTAVHQARAPGPAIERIEDRQIDTGAGSLPVRLYWASANPIAVMIYCHGGGWVLGSIEDTDAHARRIVSKTNCVLVSVDYRLAPEHPFPAAFKDTVAALNWAAAHKTELAGSDVPLIIAGDSAGGNLAAAAAIYSRDNDGPLISMQVLGYPVLDHACNTKSYQEFSEGPVLSEKDMHWFWDQYVPDQEFGADPRVSPLRAKTLARLPAAFIMTAECDPLRDEGEKFAQKLVADGTKAVCKRYPGMVHGFYRMADVLDGGRQALTDVSEFIRDRIGTT